MALDYKEAARATLEAIGGASNVVSAAHCATRLRLVIADNGKIVDDLRLNREQQEKEDEESARVLEEFLKLRDRCKTQEEPDREP